LTDIFGNQEKAIEATCEVLDVQGEILPVTYDNVQLIARYDNGKQVLGEHYIDEVDDELGKHKIVELEEVPEARVNPKVLTAVRQADLIVLGPGDLYTSIICNLIIDGVADAVADSSAKKVFVMNLMTKFGQTYGFSAKDHVDELEKYLRKGAIDVCLVNKARTFPRGVLARYRQEMASLVRDDLDSMPGMKVVRENFVSNHVYQKPKSDKLKRSLIRHDPAKVARALISLL